MSRPTIVHLIESERGWGTKIDDVREFNTLKEAENFVREFNKQYDFDVVPEYYYIAQIVQIGDK